MKPISFGKNVSADSSKQELKFNPTFQPVNSEKIENLLERSRELLSQFTGMAQSLSEQEVPSHSPLEFKYKVFQVLTPEDFAWDDCIVSLYGEKPPVGSEASNITLIVHGHDRDRCCAASTMCHVHSYEPSGQENPQFLKRWKSKWQ